MSDKLILGTAQMGMNYGINNPIGKISLSESFKILQSAYANGVSILDTAEAYGDSHQVIGQFHKEHPELKFKIITKISLNSEADDVEIIVLRALTELNVNKLEALMFHSYASYQYCKKSLDKADLLKKNNYFKYLGVSVYSNEEFRSVIYDEKIDLIQVPFNLLDNYNLRGELLELAKKEGKIVHSRSTFLQGLFFKDPNEANPIIVNLKGKLSVILQMAKKNKISISDLALGYCMSQNTINNVIIGIDSLDHFNNNLSSARYLLSNNLLKEINNILVPDRDLLNPSLWKV
jgi:aryl-alcohol dehydrogenase-like predicted oxidoreductase